MVVIVVVVVVVVVVAVAVVVVEVVVVLVVVASALWSESYYQLGSLRLQQKASILKSRLPPCKLPHNLFWSTSLSALQI